MSATATKADVRMPDRAAVELAADPDQQRAEMAAKLRLQALRKRKEAPAGAHLGEQHVDVLTEIAKQEITDPEKHAFWAYTPELHRWISKGYRVHKRHGQPVQHEELTLTWIEKELFDDAIERAGRESRERLQAAQNIGGDADNDKEMKRAGVREELSVTFAR